MSGEAWAALASVAVALLGLVSAVLVELVRRDRAGAGRQDAALDELAELRRELGDVAHALDRHLADHLSADRPPAVPPWRWG